MRYLTVEQAYAEHVKIHSMFKFKVMSLAQFIEFWNLFPKDA